MRPKRVVLLGPESTGKTSLARGLATRYGVVWAREFAREYVERHTGPLGYEDVDAIGKGQRRAEDVVIAEAVRSGHALVVLDTDLVSTVVYSRHYYGGCPQWIDRALATRLGDLYLLAGIDVPWEPDGAQRDRGHARSQLQQPFRDELVARHVDFIELGGGHECRLRAARRAVDDLIARGSERSSA